MPFKSQAQRRYLYARHPKVARRWRKEHGPQRNLPERSRRNQLVQSFVKRQGHGS